jgi:archaellum biogenesis protein FlaJ (TadC family)
MKTICVAYGDNKAMREELNSISGEREGSENDTPAHERQVEKLVSKFGMKYSEAIDIVTSGNFEKKIAEEAE